MKSYKYSLLTEKYYDHYKKFIIRNCPTEEVVISENVDSPSISVSLNRMSQNTFKRRQNSKLDKYKDIRVEDFNLYHSIVLDMFKTLRWKEESECYIDKPYATEYDIVFFSNFKPDRYRLDININYSIDWGHISLVHGYGYNRRNIIRRDATPISNDIFEYLLRKIVSYFDDFQNYEGNFDELLKLIQDSYHGKVTPIVPQHEMDLTPLVLNLNERIKQIESRLMNNDADKKGSREKLRGRMEGLKTAIHEIKGFEGQRDN